MPRKSKKPADKAVEPISPTTPVRDDIRLTQEFDTAALWMSLPRKERDPQTQGELAKQLGVHPDSISDWKKRDDYWDKVDEYRGHWVRDEISEVVAGLTKRARLGLAPEVKLFLQFAGVFTETSRTEHTGKDGKPIEVTLADLVVGAAQPHEPNTSPDDPGPSDLESAA